MKIDCVLTAVNNNELYIDFIPNFIEHWKFLFPNIKIKVVLINETIPERFKHLSEHIELFKPIHNMSTAFQAMCIRNLYPALVQVNSGILITDIDMMPMNRNYYVKPIENISDDKFITYRDVLIKNKEYPMCYNLATNKTWGKIFNIQNIDDVINTLKEWYIISQYEKKRPKLEGIIDFDQKILFSKVQQFNSETHNLVVLNDKICGYKRLDRIKKLFDDKQCIHSNDITNLKFSDYHSMRPYADYKYENDTIKNILLSSKQ